MFMESLHKAYYSNNMPFILEILDEISKFNWDNHPQLTSFKFTATLWK